MALRRTVDLLPEIFRTDTNRKFLAATLDQLIQEPSVKKTQGYVGRRVGPGVNPSNNYVTEPTKTRTDYQLEPGVVFLKPGTSTPEDAITYPGMIDSLKLQNGDTTRQDRLWESEYYSWDPFCDFDKFSNYSQYYWLPSGPDSVDVGTTEISLTDDFTVTRSGNSYSFTGLAGSNPTVTLVRGGNYTFSVDQVSNNFWIQTSPGVNGRIPSTPNISSRDVFGVINNGEDQGTVEFYVPLRTGQDFFYGLNDLGTFDLVCNYEFNQLNNIYVSAFLAENPTGIDGITQLDGRTLIFTNKIQDAEEGGWEVNTQFDPVVGNLAGAIGTFDSIAFDLTQPITSQSQRYSVWRINYVYDTDGNPFMQLESLRTVPNLSRMTARYGEAYSSTQWYKDSSGYYNRMPLLTATLDTLYYQDSNNPEIFGTIRLVDSTETQPIDVSEIIGAKTYTSPNGVTFTNGLKIQFRGPAEPAQFQNLEYYVEGVGTGPGIDLRVGFVNGEAYFGPFHVFEGEKMTGSVHTTDEFQQYIYDTLEESLANFGAGAPLGAPLPQTSTPGAALGNGIKLIPVSELVTPETYTKTELIPYSSTPYDVGSFDTSLNAPLVADYLTINRASQDRNAWSRSNRWFHIDVINYSAELNNVSPVVDNERRAKRPIIEFRPNLKLFNFGTEARLPVNIVDFRETDALSNINGQIGYAVNGYTFVNGSRVIFAADDDLQVRNRVYEVLFIDPTNSGTFIIDLVLVGSVSLINQTVVSLNGATQQGVSYWFDGVNWNTAQQKTGVNQAPLFDVYDINGVSFGNREIYPSSTFVGSRLFGYAEGGTAISDEVLGLSLKYLNIDNVGDILFNNYLYTDTFIYVDGTISITQNTSTGFARQYLDRVDFSSQLGWQTAAATTRSRQVFRFVNTGVDLILDVPVDTNSLFAPLQIFVNGIFVDATSYTYTVTATNTIITLSTNILTDAVIEVQALSNLPSKVAFYQVPLNLENNAVNGNSPEFTLGTIRTHYETIGQNLKTLVGKINGANNSRDLGDLIPYGSEIVQHSAPLILPGVFLRRQQYELFNSLTYNSQEYSKFKALLLDAATRGDYVNSTPTQVLDNVISEITIGRNNLFPFYWSDMLPAGEAYTELLYTVSPISTDTFSTTQIYNFTESNYQGLLVYLNDTILVKGYDYTVPDGIAAVIISAPLAVGDSVVIREYSTTYGSFVPNTPTKMGLYPAFKPAIYVDETYIEPQTVIRGHDGSITIAFGDFRDNVLLEFETRIFNNLKIDTPVPLTAAEVIPGQFRETDYTLQEINNILLPDFLGWVGYNKLDYTTQTYQPNNPFTYNYSQSSNRLSGAPSLGAWRGIYNYFYDTITPNTTPWEMLGFSEQPDWWEVQYGPAPYTSGNMVLWEDLEAGYIADPTNPRINPHYARPGLTKVIPSGSEGALLSPLVATIGNYDATSFRRSWAFGDDGPVESTWRTSSSWPFAVMRLLALTKPAKFFSLFADRDNYVYNNGLAQFLWKDRYRLTPTELAPLYGDGTSKASYIDWIVDYNQQRGVNSSENLVTTFDSVDVRLCWRLAAFSDKKYLKIYTERSTPSGSNAGLLLPDESYQLLLYQNSSLDQATYSSVVVQTTADGWAVFGYNALASYFEILASRVNGKSVAISSGGSIVKVPVEYTNNIVRVPYGFVFTNRTALCDFLLSYGRLLEERGFAFEGRENGYIMNWNQMAQEFLYWSNQGWASGSIINLNPGATRLSITKPGLVVESMQPPRLDSIILNQSRQAIPPSDLVIDRFENTFRVTSLTGNSINFLNVRFTAYEHMVILDNRSIFADLIYDPITGGRQSRVQVAGWLSREWNGTVNAPGFILNQNNVPEWVQNRKYTKGDIVLFKNEYWSASTIIQPSANFDYGLWIKSDYASVQKGLLPNAANASDQLATSYSVYDANLEQEIDLFSYGLIGFRPRPYMSALNLDDVSQVQLYQQFLASKGTKSSLELFSYADLGKETAQYSIYEYWAMLRSTYGANANSSFFELLLNEELLPSDPSLIQIIQPGEPSVADQKIFVNDIWKSSYKITSPDILPVVTETVTDIGFPSAGYVNFDDVNVTLFSLDNTTNLNDDINSIGIGSIVWVAKVNTYDWNIYRADKVPGTLTKVENNLSGASIATFNRAHGLAISDVVIIKNFDADVNGVYRVRSVPSISTILIDYVFTGTQNSITGEGLVLTLDTSRVAQPSDIVNLPYADQLTPGVKVWVDNNSRGQWTVLEKSDVFSELDTLTPVDPVSGSQFGASVSQGFFNQTALIGAPGFNPASLASAPGAVFPYVLTDTGSYEQDDVLTLDATAASGYGNAIDIGNQNWAVIGASDSNNRQGYATSIYVQPSSNFFEQRQLLVTPDQNFNGGEFGYSVTMSQNERWMYISAPEHNRVFAYTRVDVQQQTASYITDGTTVSYNWSNYLNIDYLNPQQLAVTLNNAILTYPNDYSVLSSNIVLSNTPIAGKLLKIIRRNDVQLDQQTYTAVTQTTTSGIGSGAEFTVNRVRGTYFASVTSGGEDYNNGDTITIAAASIGGGTSPANDLTITVTTVDGYGAVQLFTQAGTGVSNTSIFPLDQYLRTATNIYSFTVTVNDVLQRPHIDYDFNSDSSLLAYDLVFNTIPPAGAVIIVKADSYFACINEEGFTVPGIDLESRFGQSISTTTNGNQVMIGAPDADQNEAGKTYIFDRNIEKIIVTDAAQTDYYPVSDMIDPGYVAVSVNGVYLINTEFNIGGTFTVDTTNPSSQFVNITAPLSVGDIIDIETNQIVLLETIESATPNAGAKFGWKLDQCINDCSLYISAPYDSEILPQAGKVEVFRNQARVYGTVTSTIANPTLTAGDYIRINNVFIESTGTTVSDLVDDILLANLPNATASTTPDLVFEGDGTSQVFDVGNIYSDVASYTTVVYVNNVLQAEGPDYNYNNTTKQITFTVAPFNSAEVVVVSGRITFSVKNYNASTPFNRLSVLPGQGTLFDDLGIYVYAWQQKIVSPVPQTDAHFGEGLFISDDTLTLMVGAPNGTTIAPTTFDAGITYFDSHSTNFADPVTQSGAVYEYDSLPSATASSTNPDLFVFGQQFVNIGVQPLDEFGRAIDYTTGILLIGAPGSDLNSDVDTNYGKVVQYQNTTNGPAWTPIRVQSPAVNVDLLDTMYLYDRINNTPKQYLDYFDPLQGRLLGAVQQNINYNGAVDPAAYNVGTLNNYGSKWTQEHVGEIWWDTANVRFIDPNQDDPVYASRRWGQVFPGSTIDVYQWISSSTPPAEYTGLGTPRSTNSYAISTLLTEAGNIDTTYYFWVSGINVVNTTAKKTLSTTTIASYIENPRSSGISYLAPINPSTLALYNSSPYISAQDTVLHVEYDRQKTEDAIHVEYQLIPQGRPEGFLTDSLYRKFLDSMTGSDTVGRPVPDPLLSPSLKYGIEFRPRQSMFINRFLALKNYIVQSNTVLAQFPITEIRSFNLLDSFDPEPTANTGAWDKRVANYEELSYQNLATVPLGYRYLVASDSTNNGLWSIYQVIPDVLLGNQTLGLIRVQNYDTRNYWTHIDWYLPGYNPLTRVVTEVPNQSALDTITVANGSSVKVTANAQGKWEIYLRENNTWARVGLQDGTIEISATLYDYSLGRFGFDSEVFDAQYFDQAPIIETRKILEALNQELLIGELLIERNNLLILMFNFILSEQQAPTWLTKTSLIDVDHVIRDLVPYQIYRRDNQDFVLDYINEVKPYHVQIREFNLKYQGLDLYPGSINDFDLPAYWDPAENLFISPVLDNSGNLSTTSSRASTNPIWSTYPWNQWYQNYLLEIDSVTIVEPGSGYTSPPTVTVTGECERQALMEARINSAGEVTSIVVIDPGAGYTTSAIITLTEGNGSGAQAVAVMGNPKIRSLLTVMKYDRYEYQSNVLPWEANVNYDNGTLVRYNDRVWSANSDDSTAVKSSEFDPQQWTLIAAGDLSGVDRTMGFYTPTAEQPGLDLALLISGVDYPGVQVAAPDFNRDTGFDVGGFDVNPFDNISYGPDGTPSYDPAILDTIYASSFTDPYLGILPDGAPVDTRPGAVLVDGGAFVDTYESHAPEELVPGITYDTLDIRVFTTPGADWDGQGHGFPTEERNYVYTTVEPILNFAGVIAYPVTVVVYNQTQKLELDPTYDYSIDWENYEITVLDHAVNNDIITVVAYSLGGGNQLYTNTYLESDVVDDTLLIPITYSIVQSFAIFINGFNYTNYTFSEGVPGTTILEFGSSLSSNDRITLTALGASTAGGSNSWSVPVTQTFVSNGSLTYTLTNSLQGTNPVNLIVNKNGVRARPYEGVEYIGDGSSLEYNLPGNGDYNLGLVSDNDVFAYVDNVPQILGVGFIVNPLDGTARTINFFDPPAIGASILIAVRTKAQYWVTGTTLAFQPAQGLIPVEGDIITVTTYNDTAEQNILTQVFVGPDTQGLLISEAYDDTTFDEGNITGDPGSFDYSEGTQILINRFNTGRVIVDPTRLMVTLDGNYLFANQGFEVQGTDVIINGSPISAAQVVAITSFSESVVPTAMAFRIFQDMRGVQSTYRITDATSTTVAQAATSTDDVIYVTDASKLSAPNLPQGIFGLVTINGERIAYREIDTVANTISGLRRGTAGTGADEHLVGAAVYDIGVGNYLRPDYQDRNVDTDFLGDATTTEFTTELTLVDLTSTELEEAVLVYVGGALQVGNYTVTDASPVTVVFDTPPPNGYQVTIRVRQGQSWYQPGGGNPSNGVPLQETDTEAARFLRGQS